MLKFLPLFVCSTNSFAPSRMASVSTFVSLVMMVVAVHCSRRHVQTAHRRSKVRHLSLAVLYHSKLHGTGIARWWCVGLAVLLDAVSWVRYSSEIFFLVEGIFSLGVNMGFDPPPQLFRMRVCKPRSSLCTHAFHRTDSKDPDIHVLDR